MTKDEFKSTIIILGWKQHYSFKTEFYPPKPFKSMQLDFLDIVNDKYPECVEVVFFFEHMDNTKHCSFEEAIEFITIWK